MENTYKLKYPVLLVHGMGFRDNKYINYWGRIPEELEKMGCLVFYGEQDSNASVETNGEHLKLRIEKILSETGAEKVNIIAHSKGGLDSRYAISTLKMGSKVASLTTMSTPHNGSKTVDKLLKFPDFIVKFAAFCTDICFKIAGDKNPSSYKVFHLFSTKGAEGFNKNNPDDNNVYYQSYAFVMKNPTSDMFMWLQNLVVSLHEGENDGLLTPESVKWGNFKGIFRGNGRRGISHCDEIDLRRKHFSKKKGDGVSDIVDIYKGVIIDLYNLGF